LLCRFLRADGRVAPAGPQRIGPMYREADAVCGRRSRFWRRAVQARRISFPMRERWTHAVRRSASSGGETTRPQYDHLSLLDAAPRARSTPLSFSSLHHLACLNDLRALVAVLLTKLGDGGPRKPVPLVFGYAFSVLLGPRTPPFLRHVGHMASICTSGTEVSHYRSCPHIDSE
jgi:hypothetical protein